MLKYQYKIVHLNGFVVLERRNTLFGIIPLNSWKSQTSPFNSVKTLNNICDRRGIKKLRIENLEEYKAKQNQYEDYLC